MSREEQEIFLERPLIGVLSVINGMRSSAPYPLQAPVWFVHGNERRVLVLTSDSTEKAECLMNSPWQPHASLCIQESNPTATQYMTIMGAVSFADPTEGLVREVARKYLPPDARDMYVKACVDNLVLCIRPDQVYSGVLLS